MASFLRQVYDLDTLDTRFTTPTSVPYKAIVDAHSDSAVIGGRAGAVEGRPQHQQTSTAKTPPPRWKTTEFYFYYLVTSVTVPYMWWVAYDLSRRASFLLPPGPEAGWVERGGLL